MNSIIVWLSDWLIFVLNIRGMIDKNFKNFKNFKKITQKVLQIRK
jgi:hypothetical protein